MATGAMPNSERPLGDAMRTTGGADEGTSAVWRSIAAVLAPVASLKLTVVLLSLSIVIVFVGTLAQVDQDMWDVIAHYFDAWFCWVPLQVFFPRSWFPDFQDVPGRFPFVGGKSIGLAMLINLFAAHFLRFKVQAKGRTLGVGLAVLAAGVALTTLVIVAGHDRGGLQGKPPFSWTTLWWLVKAAIAVAWAAAGWRLYRGVSSKSQKYLLIGANVLLGLTAAILWTPGNDLYLGDAGMRILWQLFQGEFAALALLAGSIVLFRKRAGVVLIHAGIGLLMLGQLLVNLFAVEERMSILEGETINYVHDIRAVELAIVDTSAPDKDQVLAVPLTEKNVPTSYLEAGAIEPPDPRWPFRLEIVKFLKNSTLPRLLDKDETNLATAGVGAKYTVDETRKAAGADSDGAVDMSAAWVKFTSRDGAKDHGTYLLSQMLANTNRVERLTIDGRTFELALRFKRTYKPYAFSLIDVRKDDYPGTTIAKNYSSDLRLTDAGRGFEEQVKIKMNEPLRYAGETFYQSSYQRRESGIEATELQVVTNTGWMIPYVACMIVGTGMVAHFGIVLVRFLDRMTQDQPAGAAGSSLKEVAATGKRRGRTGDDEEEDEPASGWKRWRLPAIVTLVFLVLVGGLARTPKAPVGKFDYYEFGKLPVLEKGRVKPLDTLARNTLRVISNQETFKDEKGDKQPAIVWLAEVIAETDRADEFQVFRIENLDVLNTLGLDRRKNLRYSVNELRKNIDKFESAVEAAKKKPKEAQTTYERKLIELDGRIRTYTLVRAAFRPLPIPPIPTEAEFNKDRQAAETRALQIRQMLLSIPEADRQLAAMQPPRAIPAPPSRDGDESADKWLPYATAWNRGYLASIMTPDQKADRATVAFSTLLDSYVRGDAEGFNIAVRDYRKLLGEIQPDLYVEKKAAFESWFNVFAPFFYMMFFYVIAFVITAFGWVASVFGRGRSAHRIAFWLVVGALTVHSLALVARIVISGRPPITNLYSSAIFIGWACAVFGVALEKIIRKGIGNSVAAFAGFITLLIAHYLSLDGDTVAVMVAVLDTQFWLSTHVVCITLGYAATFVAGLLAAAYLITDLIPKALDAPAARRGATTLSLGKLLATAIYGVICFAILFSFVGTVLGGLWADDSWGRFWGWDPKENGALIIVLWNALILHARWDGLVRERGLAVLSVAGNIVTCWSWFGVNELGVGLHSYGFTEGVLLYLTITVVAHLALMATALIPWLRDRRRLKLEG